MPDAIPFEQLTPEEQAAVKSAGLAPEAAPSNDPVDLTDTARDLAEFFKKAPPTHSVGAWMANPNNVERMKTDPALKQKVEDAHRIVEEETTWLDKGKALAKQAVTHPGETAMGLVKMGGGLLLHGAADVMQGGPVVKALRSVGVKAPTTLDIAAKVLPKVAEEQVKRIADTLNVEAMAGHEAAGVGIAAMGAGAAENVKEFFLRGAEEAESTIAAALAGSGDDDAMREAASTDMRIDADRQRRSNERLWGKAGLAEQEREIMAGKGPVTKALTGGATEDFSEGRAEWLAAGSPVGLAGFEAGVGALRGVTKAILQAPTRLALRGAEAAEAAARAPLAETATAAMRATQKRAAAEALAEPLPPGMSRVIAPEVAMAEDAAQVARAAEAQTMSDLALREAGIESAAAKTATLREELARKSISDYVLGEGVAQGIAEGAAAAVAPVASAVKGAALGAAAGAVGVMAAPLEAAGKVALKTAPSGLTPQYIKIWTDFAEGVRKRAFNVSKGYLSQDTTVLGPKSRALYDVAGAAGQAGADAIKGFALLDLPLAIATSQTPDEAAQAPLFGTAFGLVGGALRGGKQFVRGQEIDERNWAKPTTPYKEYGNKGVSSPEANYDQATSLRVKDATLDLNPEEHQQKVNAFLAIRELVDKAGGEAYWLPEENFKQMQERFKDQNANAQPDAPGLVVQINGKPVTFVRDPGVAPHESTHIIQRIAGQEAMDRFYEQLYGVYAPYWEPLGVQMAIKYGADPKKAVSQWQTALLDSVGAKYSNDPAEISVRANRLLASELHAEILDTVVKHDGASLIKQGEGRPWYSMGRVLANAASLLAGVYESIGQQPYGEPFSGAEKVSDVMALPITREAVEMVRGQAREHLRTQALPESVQILPKSTQAKPAPVIPTAATPATPAPTTPTPAVPENAQAKIDALPAGPAKEGAQAAKQAIETVSDLKLIYKHKLGTPAAEVASERAKRRSEIAVETDKVAVEEVLTPIRMMTDKSVPQLWVLRRAVLDANTAKLKAWRDGLSPETRAKFEQEYPILKVLDSEPAMTAFWDQAANNARQGRTLAGEEFPTDWVQKGYWAPETKAGKPTKLAQNDADVLNYIFGIPVAGSRTTAPRVVMKGVVPVDVAAQRLTEATAPGRLSVQPIRPAYKGKAAEREGVAGIELREVNPFRAKVEAQGGAPSLIEAFHRLNVEDIISVEPARVEGANLGGVEAFPRQAGFQAPKVPEKEYLRSPAIKDMETGRLRTGSMHPWVRDEIMVELLRDKLPPGMRAEEILEAPIYTLDAKSKALRLDAYQLAAESRRFQEGFYTSEGRFVDRKEGLKIAREQEQLRRPVEEGREWLDSDDLNIEASFASPKELRDMGMEKLQDLRHYTSKAKHAVGGATGLAYDIGLATTTPEGLRELAENMREQRQIYADGLAKMKSGEIDPAKGFDALQPASTKGQLFREAAEAATGTGSAGEYLRKKGYTDTDFPMLGASFAAKTETGKAKEAEGYEFRHTGEKGVRGVVVLKDGSPVGEIISHVPQKYGELFKGDEVWVDAVEVNREHRGKDLGQALYRELLTTLKDDGHTKVLGMVVAPEPLAIREKVLGPGNTRYTVDNKPATLDGAIEAAKIYKFATVDEDGQWKVPSIGTESTITPEAQFQAPITKAEAEKRVKAGEFTRLPEIGREVLSADKMKFLVHESGEFRIRERPTGPQFQGSKDRLAYGEPEASFAAPKKEKKPAWLEATEKAQKEMEDRFRDEIAEEKARIAKPLRIPKEYQTAQGPRVDTTPTKWTLKPATPDSKAWILPNGKPHMLGGEWHDEALAKWGEQWGIKFDPDNPTSQRQEALTKGFVRVNYTNNGGRLSIELRATDLRKQRGAIERLIEANLDKVDKIHVSLFDRAAERLIDESEEPIFRLGKSEKFPAALEMLDNLRTGSVSFAAPLSDPAFKDELKKIREGKAGGQTFNRDGSVWQPPEAGADLVSLASVNVPVGKLSEETFAKATSPYDKLLDKPEVVAGVFAFPESPTASIDVNAVVPQEYRANTLDFAKKNDQISVWDAKLNEEVKTGGSGNTKLKSPGELSDALEAILEGKTVDVEEIIRKNEGASFAAPKRGEEQPELFKSGGYPEAVRAREGEPVEYGIKDSPLAKEAGDEKAAVRAYADKMVAEARQLEKHPVLKQIWNQGVTWYRRFVPMVKAEFGKEAPLFTQLLAGTSPRTSASVNFGFAYDAYLSLKDGRFDTQITKFLEGYEMLKDGSWEDTVEPGTSAARFMKDWIEKYDLKPRQSNGKLYGTHSARVLQVLAGVWKQMNEGPKTDNFDQNLLGTGHEATIDMWAARLLRRLGYEGHKKRWRILPEDETAVTDEDFFFSQAVFREAAKRLKVRPDDLQGAFWLTEKQLWSDKHWADLDLGDFAKEMEDLETRRVGYKENLGQGPQSSFDLTVPKVEPRVKR